MLWHVLVVHLSTLSCSCLWLRKSFLFYCHTFLGTRPIQLTIICVRHSFLLYLLHLLLCCPLLLGPSRFNTIRCYLRDFVLTIRRLWLLLQRDCVLNWINYIVLCETLWIVINWPNYLVTILNSFKSFLSPSSNTIRSFALIWTNPIRRC